MESKNAFQNERFDSYLNKIIIYSSKTYYKGQMDIANKEKVIADEEDASQSLGDFSALNKFYDSIDTINTALVLKDALQSLSAIEQSVIFLLFERDLTQCEVAKILKLYTTSISKIKNRALKKLRKYLNEEDLNNEK